VVVGGTTLDIRNGAWAGETAWNDTVVLPNGFRCFQNPHGGGGARTGDVSGFAPVPLYQSSAGINSTSVNPAGAFDVFSGTGRGVPDVSADADPNTGYHVWLPSQSGDFNDREIVGGTSTATPLWAALAGLIEQNTGLPLGWFNPILYEIGADQETTDAFHDITQGTNITTYTPFSPYPNESGPVDSPTYLGYAAGKGFELVTDWGSPQGQDLLTAIRATSNT
jgi:kumamolisin